MKPTKVRSVKEIFDQIERVKVDALKFGAFYRF
jgi:hypothetical protein